jgi:hypothetical protein
MGPKIQIAREFLINPGMKFTQNKHPKKQTQKTINLIITKNTQKTNHKYQNTNTKTSTNISTQNKIIHQKFAPK